VEVELAREEVTEGIEVELTRDELTEGIEVELTRDELTEGVEVELMRDELTEGVGADVPLAVVGGAVPFAAACSKKNVPAMGWERLLDAT
jgi:hypothetical protein